MGIGEGRVSPPVFRWYTAWKVLEEEMHVYLCVCVCVCGVVGWAVLKWGLGSPEEEEDDSLHTAVMQQSHGHTQRKERERTAITGREKRGSKVKEVERGGAATLSAPKGGAQKASYT